VYYRYFTKKKNYKINIVKSAYIKVFIYVRVHKDFMLIPVHSDKKFAFKADVTSYNHNIKIPNKFLKM
jgi:hypothetical protein